MRHRPLTRLLLLGALLTSGVAYADPITYPKSWSPFEVLNAADLNGNFAAVQSSVNGNLDSNNLKPTAAIRGTQLADAPNGVPTQKLNNGAVTTQKIGDGAVTLSKMASNSVNSATIVDASIQSVDLADGAITSADLGLDSVTPDNVLSTGQTDLWCLTYQAAGDTWAWRQCNLLAVENPAGVWTEYPDADGVRLARGETVEWSVSPGAPGEYRVNPEVVHESLGDQHILDDSLTSASLAPGSVSTSELLDGGVMTADLADGSVTAEKLAVGFLNVATNFFGTCNIATFAYPLIGGTQDVCTAASSYIASGGPAVAIGQCELDIPAGSLATVYINADGSSVALGNYENTGGADELRTLTTLWMHNGFSAGTPHTVKLQVALLPASGVTFVNCRLVMVEFN